MTNGFRQNSFYNDKGFEEILSSEDVVEASIGQPMAKEPGEEFNYNDGDAHLLSGILTKTTGQSALPTLTRTSSDPWESTPTRTHLCRQSPPTFGALSRLVSCGPTTGRATAWAPAA
jgi:hypothetical protein